MLIFVINRKAFGWTMEMQIYPMTLVQAALIAVVAALLAGVYPAFRMSRSSPAGALQEDRSSAPGFTQTCINLGGPPSVIPAKEDICVTTVVPAKVGTRGRGAVHPAKNLYSLRTQRQSEVGLRKDLRKRVSRGVDRPGSLNFSIYRLS